MEAAKGFIDRFVLTRVPVSGLANADYKTALQELVQQKRNQSLVYALVGESGPDHDKVFQVELTLNGSLIGRGSGGSKKRAEQEAARVALEALQKKQ
jgi:ribonuclease-3